MKQINFFSSLPPKKQQAIHRWFWFSCVIILSLLLGMTLIYLHLSKNLKVLQQEYASLEPTSEQLTTCLTEKSTLKKQTDQLKDQLAKTTRIKQQPKNPAKLMELIIKALPSGATMQTVALKKKKLDLILMTATTADALAYTQKLKKHTLFGQVNITALEPVDNNVKVTIEALLK